MQRPKKGSSKVAKKAKACPAWLATFADLMSLLMALFVLLFAMSTMEVPKYQSVVESLSEALGSDGKMTEEQKAYFQSALEEAVESKAVVDNSLEPLFEKLKESYSQTDKSGEIKIEYDVKADEIRLVFPEKIAFDPGRANLKPKFVTLLKRFVQLKNEQVDVHVLGHTDSRPVVGGRFKSNWELSSARSASVIEQLIKDQSIKSTQAQAIGLADTQPLAIGTSELDYAKNRRVEILITTQSFNQK